MKISLLIWIFSSFFISCEAHCPPQIESSENAILNWTGASSENGCGFLLMIDNHVYKAVNQEVLNDSFLSDKGIKVSVTFEKEADLKVRFCGDPNNPVIYERIVIISIEKL